MKKEKLKKLLNEVEDLKSSTLEAIPHAVFNLQNRRITYANKGVTEVFGWKPEELIGKTTRILYRSDKDYKKIRNNFYSVLKKNQSYKTELSCRRKDGKDIVCRMSGAIIGEKLKNKEVVIIYTDITALKNREKVQSALYKISESGYLAKNLKGLCKKIHKEIASLMPAENFYIALYDKDSKMFNFAYWVDEKEKKPALIKAQNGITEYVFNTGKPFIANSKHIKKLKNSDTIKIRGIIPVSWLGVPLKNANEVIGVVAMCSYTKDVLYTEEDKNILTFISEQVATTIKQKEMEEEQKALFKAEREQRLQTETLAKIQLSLISKTSLEEVLDEILSQMKMFVPSTTANIVILEGSNIRMVRWTKTTRPLKIKTANNVHPVNEFKTNIHILKTKKPLIIYDTKKSPHWTKADKNKNTRSYLGVPIILKDTVCALAQFASTKPGNFSNEDIKKLQPLTNAAAIAIEKARLLEEEKEQRLQAETFAKMLLALTSATTLNDVFDEILKQANYLVQHNASNIALIKGNALYNVYWKGYKKYGMEKFIVNAIQPLDEYKIPGAAIKAKKILVISDTTKEPDWILLKETAWIKSHIAVPIALENRVLGMLRLDSEIPNKFSETDAKKLKSLAHAAAIAIEKARLLEEEKEQRLQAEILAKITIALTSKSTLNEVFDEILNQTNLIVPSDASRISLIKNDIIYTAYQKGYEKYKIKEFIANLKLPIKEYKIPGKAIKEKKILIIPDTTKEPDWKFIKETAWEKSYAVVPIILHNRVLGVLKMASETPNKFSKEDAKKLQPLANAAAIAIEKARLLEDTRKEIKQREKAEKNVKESYKKLQKTMQGTIFTLAKIVEMKDPYTAGHQRRVAQLSEIIAKEMRFSKKRIEALKTATLLHDIGKINIPSEILTKPTKLLPIEFSLIKEHPLNSYEMIKNIEFPGPVAKIVLQHHERMDGSGYPNGLKGNEIMLEARILAVADVAEAMSSHRPYRPALGVDKALEEIEKNKGILYDQRVANVCIKLFKEKGFKFEE